jgi:zinc/manganese transport system substrate-binding protein
MQVRRVFGPMLVLAYAMLSPAVQAADKVKVIASFSIVGDFVRQVGGDRVDVTVLAGPDADMHAFEPTPADARKLKDAQVVAINGLGFEGWADRLVKSSGFKGERLVASKGIKALAARDDDHDHGHKKGDSHGRYDPHAWQEVANVKTYVANIRDTLAKVDAAGAAEYRSAAARYLKTLDALEAEIKSAIASVPKAKRRVITSHDAFSYYGDAYGIAFLAPQGATGKSEPSARDVARLIRQIKKEGIKAVFVENISNPRLIERIAKDTGARIGGTLYSDALSRADGPAATYVDMMRHNTRLLTAAMAQ